jgi:hypothetical protein
MKTKLIDNYGQYKHQFVPYRELERPIGESSVGKYGSLL